MIQRTHGFAPPLYNGFANSRNDGFPPWKTPGNYSSIEPWAKVTYPSGHFQNTSKTKPFLPSTAPDRFLGGQNQKAPGAARGFLVNLTKKSLAGGPDRIAHGGERLVGVGSQRRNGRDADHDDERQHDGVFDRRGAIFLLQVINFVILLLLSAAWRSTQSTRQRWTHGFAPPCYHGFTVSRKLGFPPWKAPNKTLNTSPSEVNRSGHFQNISETQPFFPEDGDLTNSLTVLMGACDRP